MVHGVAGGTVDDRRVVRVLAVVDQDSPDVDEDEEEDVCELGQGKYEGEDVVGQTLSVAVGGVERVRGEGSRHNPLVVWLVDVLVDAGVVQTTVDPVDGRVGEEEEERELQVVVPESRALVYGIVQLRVSADLEQEPGYGEDGHDGEGDVGLFHLLLDLVFEVSWVVEGGLVKDEVVRGACENVVDEYAKEPTGLLGEFSHCVWGSAYHVIRYNERACRRQSSRVHWLM